MPAAADATAERIRDVNTRYHDVAAARVRRQVGDRLRRDRPAPGRGEAGKALGGAAGEPFGDALEIGAGTGYFSLNLLQLGTDRAGDRDRHLAGDAASARGERRRARARGRARCVTEAERLPFADESFDLVFGHAVLHHIPDLERAFAEFFRVLRPGGTVAFCGEPSRYGDRIAALPKRAALARRAALAARGRRRRARRGTAGPTADDGHALEAEVDVHAFDPAELRGALRTRRVRASRVRGEELLANIYGWGLRTVESTAEPEEVPMGWRHFAFRSYLALQRVDTPLLEPRLPPELFYNLCSRPEAGLSAVSVSLRPSPDRCDGSG